MGERGRASQKPGWYEQPRRLGNESGLCKGYDADSWTVRKHVCCGCIYGDRRRSSESGSATLILPTRRHLYVFASAYLGG